MKLAEALRERADLMVRLAQLKSRMLSNVQVQEGEAPAEDPNELLEEYDRCSGRFEELICRINLTNTATLVEGKPLTALLARRDVLSARMGVYRSIAERAADRSFRSTRTEIKTVATVNVKALQKRADDCAREFRELDNTIQSVNWSTELQ